MATVKKRGSKWQCRYYDPQGEEKSATFRLKGEADRFATTVEAEKLRGTYVDPKAGRITIGELGVTLLGTKTDRNTAAWYRNMLRHVNARWENEPVAKLTHLEVQTWITIFSATHGQPTVRGVFLTLHEIAKLALHSRLIGYDPCLDIKLPPRTKTEMLFLAAQQIGLLASAMDEAYVGEGWGTLVRFAAVSGCRAGECGGLKVKHLDLLRNRVRIAVARKTYGTDGTTKTGKSRWVHLPKALCDELAAHLASRPHGPEDRVWTGERGGPLNHHWFYERRFKPVVQHLSDRGLLPTIETEDEAGDIQHSTLRFHDLRHTCVALLIGKGKQQYEVMEHLGHTSIKTTIDTYGHLFPSVHEDIRSALEECWAEGIGAPVALAG